MRCERHRYDIKLSEVARFTSGHSKQTMAEVKAMPTMAESYLPEKITAVTRDTRIRDCLALMLADRQLYCPVTESSKPIGIISLRDINMFLGPQIGEISILDGHYAS